MNDDYNINCNHTCIGLGATNLEDFDFDLTHAFKDYNFKINFK